MHPLVEHRFGLLHRSLILSANPHGIVVGESLRQQLQQVAWPRFGDQAVPLVLLADGLAKEFHLTPEVVVEAPADEVVVALIPLAATGHVEHAGLQVGDHIRPLRQLPEIPVLRQ